jgi:CheY-like chemotaxis protein
MKRSMKNFDDLRFLVVDANAFGRNLIKSMLTRGGAREVVLANCGDEAIQLMQQQPRDKPFDCIVSDWYLVPFSGLELLRSIRAQQIPGVEPDTCFVLLTSFADAALVNLAVVLDANAYVLRPLSTEKLVNSIRSGFTRRWKLQSPKYYKAIDGLGVPTELLDRAVRIKRRQFHLFERLGIEETIEQPSGEDNELVQLTLAQKLDDAGEAFNADNLCLALIEELEHGDILGQDIYDAAGHLLLSRGTALTTSAIVRLQDLVLESGEGVKLWIQRDALQAADGGSQDAGADSVPVA